MNFYSRKLYALLHSSEQANEESAIWKQLSGLTSQEAEAERVSHRWQQLKDNNLPQGIASSSDRVNLKPKANDILIDKVRHPISSQERRISKLEQFPEIPSDALKAIAQETDAKKVFWWFWRFYPEAIRKQYNDFLLYPAHTILPDCPLHSYRSTVSALVGAGAMYPESWQQENHPERPYLLLFTFSPVQEFIKASRKFVDFWAGSYLLHYLGAELCWHIAQTYGPDAVITPSLWGQEIIDALILKEYPNFQRDFETYTGNNPKNRFECKQSNSLSTAGFPNVITALVPGEDKAKELGEKLAQHLTEIWTEIGYKVRDKIREQVQKTLEKNLDKTSNKIKDDFLKDFQINSKQEELEKWLKKSNWQWNKIWKAQLSNTWETYWTVIPLGHPEQDLSIQGNNDDWLKAQQQVSQSRQQIPTDAEKHLYESMNVGTWWGSLQQRLGQSIQAVKNTRNWRIPPAPGERSTLSGQFSAVHPNLLYNEKFQEGGGLPLGSLRLFWRVMKEAFPGLFNGSERLNAIELTKRMAWVYGGVADSLGVGESLKNSLKDSEPETAAIADELNQEEQEEEKETNNELINIEFYIRFPNLSAIAAARFAYKHPQTVKQYWHKLEQAIQEKLPDKRDRFGSLTRRPFQIPKTDKKLNPENKDGKDYNGVMFSSKWLADDLGLQNDDEIQALREAIAQTHKECGFGNSSPSDWWVIVVGDGDGMGQYVSGRKLKDYKDYLIEDAIAQPTETESLKKFQEEFPKLQKTKKRMGPATHVGLNRALLDFSNRLVPYLTEKRCCGRVIYSGGDDVLAVLPLEDLPLFLRSLRAAWSGKDDPGNENNEQEFIAEGGYWTPNEKVSKEDLVHRPYFTMGKDATMSLGIVIAHKSVPLPTVLETLWEAEKERAKKLTGAKATEQEEAIPLKDGLCFRVIYSSGNVLEALMKGHLLDDWCRIIEDKDLPKQDFSPLLYRLAEELPRRCAVTPDTHLFREAAKVIISRREESKKLTKEQEKQLKEQEKQLLDWLDAWEKWADRTNPKQDKSVLGTQPEDLGYLLRFTAFWCDRLSEREQWGKEERQ